MAWKQEGKAPCSGAKPVEMSKAEFVDRVVEAGDGCLLGASVGDPELRLLLPEGWTAVRHDILTSAYACAVATFRLREPGRRLTLAEHPRLKLLKASFSSSELLEVGELEVTDTGPRLSFGFALHGESRESGPVVRGLNAAYSLERPPGSRASSRAEPEVWLRMLSISAEIPRPSEG